MEKHLPRTFKPMVAGILSITVGTFDLLGTMGLIIAMAVIGTADLIAAQDLYPLTVSSLNAVLATLAVFLSLAGILAIVGGIFALQRKIWGLGLAGSIAATVTGSVLGIASIVFMALSKDEFV
jgi:hypothetical protein